MCLPKYKTNESICMLNTKYCSIVCQFSNRFKPRNVANFCRATLALCFMKIFWKIGRKDRRIWSSFLAWTNLKFLMSFVRMHRRCPSKIHPTTNHAMQCTWFKILHLSCFICYPVYHAKLIFQTRSSVNHKLTQTVHLKFSFRLRT